MEAATLDLVALERLRNRLLEVLAETPMAVSVGVPAILSESSAVEEFGKEIEFNRGYDLKYNFDAVVESMTESYRSRLGNWGAPQTSIWGSGGYDLKDTFEAFDSMELYRPRLGHLGVYWGGPKGHICHLWLTLSSRDLKVCGSVPRDAVVWREMFSLAGNKMTMETSSKGGFDIVIGYYKVHVPKYASVHHPLIQMVLFARTLYDSTLRCLQSVAPKSIVEFYAEGLVSTKTKAHSPNTVSARKDVENYSITPGKDKNISKLGEVDYNVDLSTVPVHSGGSAQENVYNLHSLTSAPSSADHGITKAEDDTEHLRLTNVAKAVDKTDVTWVLATAAVHHATGNRDLLSDFTTSTKELSVKAGDGVSMPVCGHGSVITGTVVLQDVWFVPGLTQNLVSVTQLTDLDYNVGFARGACVIKGAADGIVIGKAHVSQDRLFEVDFLKVGPVI